MAESEKAWIIVLALYKDMAWKLRCGFALIILLYAAVRSESWCSKKEKVSILLNVAKEFILKAKDSHPHCSYSGYFTQNETSSTLMHTAKILILAAKNEFLA
ncbi:hypothetical protein JTE90_019711, partial [Oedothorax gibbosus]